jgi:hypothetical protein
MDAEDGDGPMSCPARGRSATLYLNTGTHDEPVWTEIPAASIIDPTVESSTVVPDPNPDDESTWPTVCEHCESVAQTSPFQGYNHGPDEWSYLCGPCHDDATTED